MSSKNESEAIFEAFCTDLSIPFTRIPCKETQTPDYSLQLNEHVIIAEVKQLDLNGEDNRNWDNARARGVGSAWGGTEERLGKKIKKANRQLKARCNGTTPV